jgi:hypothetical protein
VPQFSVAVIIFYSKKAKNIIKSNTSGDHHSKRLTLSFAADWTIFSAPKVKRMKKYPIFQNYEYF